MPDPEPISVDLKANLLEVLSCVIIVRCRRMFERWPNGGATENERVRVGALAEGESETQYVARHIEAYVKEDTRRAAFCGCARHAQMKMSSTVSEEGFMDAPFDDE